MHFHGTSTNFAYSPRHATSCRVSSSSSSSFHILAALIKMLNKKSESEVELKLKLELISSQAFVQYYSIFLQKKKLQKIKWKKMNNGNSCKNCTCNIIYFGSCCKRWQHLTKLATRKRTLVFPHFASESFSTGHGRMGFLGESLSSPPPPPPLRSKVATCNLQLATAIVYRLLSNIDWQVDFRNSEFYFYFFRVLLA